MTFKVDNHFRTEGVILMLQTESDHKIPSFCILLRERLFYECLRFNLGRAKCEENQMNINSNLTASTPNQCLEIMQVKCKAADQSSMESLNLDCR